MGTAFRRQAGSSQGLAQHKQQPQRRAQFCECTCRLLPRGCMLLELHPHRSSPPAALLPQELTEEERQDAFKRTLARMKKVGRRNQGWREDGVGCALP